jgi:hypothetical protein|tara:strand:+ start:786 stop:1454 length:669 start_codon:yes stop_codon:yes gene_type:complete
MVDRFSTTGFDPVFIADFSQWDEYLELLENLQDRIPSMKGAFLQRVGRSFVDFLRATVEGQGAIWTRTYIEGLQQEVIWNGDEPTLRIQLLPFGPQGARLNVYWRVLETGAEPNPLMKRPRVKAQLVAWSIAKFGSPNIGLAVVARNVREISGIMPNPILQSAFLMDESLEPFGFSPEGASLIFEALDEFKRGFEEHTIRRGSRAGRIQRIRRGARGRFIPF